MLTLLALTFALAQDPSPEPPAPPSQWAPDAGRSFVGVVIRNDTSASLQRLGHDHVIVAGKIDGAITWPATPGGDCSVDLRIPVKALTVDPPGSRERTGLDDNTIDDSSKAKLSANMWGKSQLDADSHPAVTLRAKDCKGGTGRVPVTFTLTVRGVDRTLTVPLDIAVDGERLSVRGSFDTTHTAHGFKPFAGSPFGPRNQDTLHFEVSLVARPAS